MKTRNIALFGIFRSGTNYTRTVLEWNYHCQLTTNRLGWKHGFYPIIVERSVLDYPVADTIFVTKNPFSSINSLFNYFQTNGRNIIAGKEWKQFLRQRFVIYDFFQQHSPQYRFANVVELWNSMNWNFSSIQKTEFSSVHIRYEDILEDVAFTAKTVAETLNLQPRFSGIDDFRIPSRVTRNMGDKQRQSDEDYLTDKLFNKTRYSSKEYYQLFDTDDIDFVLEALDMDLVQHLGYEAEMAVARKILEQG